MIEAKILHSESSTDSRFTNQKIRKDQEIQLQVKCFTKVGRKYSVDIGNILVVIDLGAGHLRSPRC